MKNLSFGQYYPADSLMHRLDPRIKVVLVVLYIVCTFLCRSMVSFVILTLSALALIFVSRIPFRTILRSMKPLMIILAFTFLNIFWFRGEHLLTPESWPIRIYWEGVWNAVYIFLRIFALITGTGIFLTYTTTPMDLTDALESLLSPLKKLHVPVHVFAMMMSIALRFIPTLTEETEKIMNAQKARGAGFSDGGLIKRAKALLPILIPLFVSAINRALELADAMECRCYHVGEGKTRLHVMHCTPRDFVALGILVAFGVGLVLSNEIGFGYTMR